MELQASICDYLLRQRILFSWCEDDRQIYGVLPDETLFVIQLLGKRKKRPEAIKILFIRRIQEMGGMVFVARKMEDVTKRLNPFLNQERFFEA